MIAELSPFDLGHDLVDWLPGEVDRQNLLQRLTVRGCPGRLDIRVLEPMRAVKGVILRLRFGGSTFRVPVPGEYGRKMAGRERVVDDEEITARLEDAQRLVDTGFAIAYVALLRPEKV